ncbi:glycosyltransferase involved in cell wall biosynthesis [Chryseobacterium sp. H1D6B]|uniref:glycosyltransferase family 2 protein n=1 Tax=Chryseobacterium sp. H1D6B TaxID=2940588 RepID=UPI0015CCE142|nr:glycosyltransferase family 2 protein [Chryseobacterium sp. H1D6B]MDH6251918.1 glycosyltransferase involved in cell wall biosynthesis [Chryseobacterium sp. H1D6B]
MLDISVIIPVYNAAEFLEKSVVSALQFQEVKEVILIEDKSTDNSLEICEKLAADNSRIKLFQHSDKGNHGAGATRNLGIEKATAAFITFLDADDYYLPNRFDAEKEIFRDPKIEGVFNAIGIEYLTEKGKKEFLAKFKDSPLTTVNYPAEGEEVFRGLLGLTTKTFGTFFHLNALTVRRSSIEKHHLRFNEALRVHQDSDFNIKLAYHCHLKSGIIDQAVAIRGIHDDNRITKIIQYSQQYNERQFLFWKSLYDWAGSNKLSSEYKKKIYLQYKSFDLSLKTGLKKYSCIFFEAVKNPEILKTKHRFTYLNR